MTISTQELDRLEQQANVRLQWIKDKREGRSVIVHRKPWGADDSFWDLVTKTHIWSSVYEYSIQYPEAKKREPAVGQAVLVRNHNGMTWSRRDFLFFRDGKIYTKNVSHEYEHTGWNRWKFPDDPDPVIPDESELPTIEQVQAVYNSKSAPVPEPKKRVPLTAEDWKGVWWVRKQSWDIEGRSLVLTIDERGISISAYGNFEHANLMDGWLRSQDGVTWSECSKLSEGV